MGTYILISVLILITCILLVLIVLAQNAKGGGLSSSFGGGGNNQVMGVKKTTDFLEKATWTLAIALLMLTLASNFVIPRMEHQEASRSELQDMMPAQDAGPVDLSSPAGAPPAEAPPAEAPPAEVPPSELPIDNE